MNAATMRTSLGSCNRPATVAAAAPSLPQTCICLGAQAKQCNRAAAPAAVRQRKLPSTNHQTHLGAQVEERDQAIACAHRHVHAAVVKPQGGQRLAARPRCRCRIQPAQRVSLPQVEALQGSILSRAGQQAVGGGDAAGIDGGGAGLQRRQEATFCQVEAVDLWKWCNARQVGQPSRSTTAGRQPWRSGSAGKQMAAQSTDQRCHIVMGHGTVSCLAPRPRYTAALLRRKQQGTRQAVPTASLQNKQGLPLAPRLQ